VIEPAVKAMVAEHGDLRFVHVLGDEFDRMGGCVICPVSWWSASRQIVIANDNR
jgi:hypothetical protein